MAKEKRKTLESGRIRYPGCFLIDLSTQAVLYATPLTPQFGLPVITELRKITFNSITRTVQFDSPIAKFATPSFTLENHRKWKEDRWNRQVDLVEILNDTEALVDKKLLVAEKASAIKNMLFTCYLILGEYAIGYGDIDYDSAVEYALTNKELLQEYALANGLTTEQALRELDFDYHERQTKKFRIYSYQKKFLEEIRVAQTISEVKEIRQKIQNHFWKNGFV